MRKNETVNVKEKGIILQKPMYTVRGQVCIGKGVFFLKMSMIEAALALVDSRGGGELAMIFPADRCGATIARRHMILINLTGTGKARWTALRLMTLIRRRYGCVRTAERS